VPGVIVNVSDATASELVFVQNLIRLLVNPKIHPVESSEAITPLSASFVLLEFSDGLTVAITVIAVQAGADCVNVMMLDAPNVQAVAGSPLVSPSAPKVTSAAEPVRPSVPESTGASSPTVSVNFAKKGGLSRLMIRSS
jgi:hypothetical protein